MYALTVLTPKLKEKLVFFLSPQSRQNLKFPHPYVRHKTPKKNIVLSGKAKHKNKCHLSYKVGSVLDTPMLYFLNSLTPPVSSKSNFLNSVI